MILVFTNLYSSINPKITIFVILLSGDDTVTLSNNSIQPEWRSNYRGDYKGDVKPVSTRDLITWSFQVARGMEYLASERFCMAIWLPEIFCWPTTISLKFVILDWQRRCTTITIIKRKEM